MSKIKILSKNIILIGLVGLLIIASGTAYYLLSRDSGGRSQISNTGPNTEHPVNFGPPTQEEKQETADNKQRLLNNEQALKARQQPTPNNKTAVIPVITSVEQQNSIVKVSAYVPGIFEDNGTCSAIFSKDGYTFTKTSLGTKEGSSVYCPLLTAQVTEFPSHGKWTVTLIYDSTYANGSSRPTDIEIR